MVVLVQQLNKKNKRLILLASSVVCGISLFLSACKSKTMVFQAERKAQIGGEFIRLFDDGHAEYGYGVVTEKLKAEGSYRFSNDTLYLLDESFLKHFPAGYLIVKEGFVLMESGFHFEVTQSYKQP